MATPNIVTQPEFISTIDELHRATAALRVVNDALQSIEDGTDFQIVIGDQIARIESAASSLKVCAKMMHQPAA